ncbi:hypothetical protein E2C01_042458 [Portunus trituberculatus]|uniref:Uncharacterized protein n=1 Tax=Portunus trituberculatus TaxID=210409 RepID=A0A5B7FT43_PORTR|nr:hypothetical protein [Portunus trituberculatus]
MNAAGDNIGITATPPQNLTSIGYYHFLQTQAAERRVEGRRAAGGQWRRGGGGTEGVEGARVVECVSRGRGTGDGGFASNYPQNIHHSHSRAGTARPGGFCCYSVETVAASGNPSCPRTLIAAATGVLYDLHGGSGSYPGLGLGARSSGSR